MFSQFTFGTGQDATPTDSSLQDTNDAPQRRARARSGYLDAAKRLSALVFESALSADPFGTLSKPQGSSSQEQPDRSSVTLEPDYSYLYDGDDDDGEGFALPGSFPVFRPEEPRPPTTSRAARLAPIDEPLGESARRAPVDEPFKTPVRQTQIDEPFKEPVRQTRIDEPFEEPARQALVDEPFEEPPRQTSVDEPFEGPVRQPTVDERFKKQVRRNLLVDEPFDEPARRISVDEPFEAPVRRAAVDEPFKGQVRRNLPVDEPFEEPARRTLVDEPPGESSSEESSGWEVLRRSRRQANGHEAPTRIKTNPSIQDQVHRISGSEETGTRPRRRLPSLPRAAGPPSPADPPLIAAENSSSNIGYNQDHPFSYQRKPEPFTPGSPRFQLEETYANPGAPLANAPSSRPSAPPPLTISTFGRVSRFQSPVDGLAGQADGWISSPRSPDSSDPGRSVPTLSRSNGQRRRRTDTWNMREHSEGSYQGDDYLQMPEQTGTVGYYRLYCPSGAIFSLNPIYENDISLSSFLIEHVQPPHSARDYITHIAQREWIKPSGIKMYITVPGASPELVSNLDMSGGPKYCGRSRERPFLIFVEPNNDLGRSYPSQSRLTSLPYRDLKTELPRAYYRLFGVAPSSTGTQRPIPSHHPLYEDDLSLSTLFVDHVPPPHRAKDYVACIAEREQIHPSRITLYLSAKAIGVSMTAEAQEIEDLEEIMAAEIMSSTSESDPIMVNVQLDDGSLRLGTKGEPLRLSVKARVRKLADVLLK